ncbi:MAG TPA: hypothetical protein PL041_10125 [Melioribacteraceae bacterium]|nr:hypothetical protein [Melioribacteraceae bacterium]
MKISKINKDDIISVAYGDASIFTKLKVYLSIIFNNKAYMLFKEYKTTKNAIKSIKKSEQNLVIKLPGYIKYNKPSFWSEIYCLFTLKPIIPVIYASVIIIAIFLAIIVREQVPKESSKHLYTKEQIKVADEKAKYALALIGNILQETNSTIKADIIKKKVAEPLNEGLNIINNIIN